MVRGVRQGWVGGLCFLDLGLGQDGVQGWYALDAGGDGMVLCRKPAGDIGLGACKPRIYKDVEPGSASWTPCIGWIWKRKNPARIRIEVR